MNSKEYWKNIFEKTADKDNTPDRSSFFSDVNTRALHEEVRRLVGCPIGKTIMDVGCGDGSLLRHLSSTNRLIGLDYSESMLKHAAANGLEPLRADFDNLPLAAGSCDMIVSVEALTLSDDPYACITKLMDLIVPGGCLILSVLNGCSIIRRFISPFFRVFVKQLPTPLHPAEVSSIIEECGGEIKSTSATLMMPGKSLVKALKIGSVTMYLGNNFIIKAEKY